MEAIVGVVTCITYHTIPQILLKFRLKLINEGKRKNEALELAKMLGTNPDTVRKDQDVYANAGKDLLL